MLESSVSYQSLELDEVQQQVLKILRKKEAHDQLVQE